MLRGVRPVLAPLLNRFQERLRTAIDYSTVADTVRDIARRLGSLEAGLADLDRQLTIRFDMLQLGVDAARLDQQAAGGAVREGIERLRTDQEAAASASREGHANTVSFAGLLMQRADLILQRTAIPLGADVLVRTPEGFLLAPAEDERLLAALYDSGGRLEPGTIAVLTALLRDGDWAVDVGAHIGTTVLPAARRVGPTGRIIAVEAASRARGLLERSLALNSLQDRVSLHPCAAGEATGHAPLNLGPFSGHSSLLALPEADRTETVEVRPLDAIVEPGRHIRLVKLDAEGLELQIWRGMRRIVAENPELAVLVEFGPEHLRRAGTSVEAWLAEMLAPGFAAYEVSEANGCLRPLRGVAELETVFSLNLLLLRQAPAALPALHFA
jgi:FkbM family methyltransferase